jgi:hypothetical protein
LAEAEFGERLHISGEDLVDLPYAQVLIVVDLAHGRGQQPAVGRDVQIRRHVFVWECVHPNHFGIGVGDADQRRDAAVKLDPQQRTVDRVEDDFADPRILEQHSFLSRPDVDGHQVTIGKGVIGEEERPAARIVGSRCNPVQRGAFDVGELPDAAVPCVQRADVVDGTRVTEGRVENPAGLVEVHARY